MAARETEAERLKRCRLIFETAIVENVSMAAAKQRLARRRWEEINARRTISCGTRDMGPVPDEGATPPRWMMAE